MIGLKIHKLALIVNDSEEVFDPRKIRRPKQGFKHIGDIVTGVMQDLESARARSLATGLSDKPVGEIISAKIRR